MTDNLHCPRCTLSHIKRNGHTHYGAQNHQCLECGRQFVEHLDTFSPEQQALIEKLLLERLSLRGICRVLGVALTSLLRFMEGLYAESPDDLNVLLPSGQAEVELFCLEVEADEMWSFVQKKENKQWVWLAFDRETRQIIAFYVGDRSRQSAQKLWERIPVVYRQQARFSTDGWDAYKGVIPSAQHDVCEKKSGRTSGVERFNCTLRQRCSRLVRKTLSFSKKLANHIGAIKYFLCHYNQEALKT